MIILGALNERQLLTLRLSQTALLANKITYIPIFHDYSL